MALAIDVNAQVPDSILKRNTHANTIPSFVNDTLSPKIPKSAQDTPSVIHTTILYSKDTLDATVDYGSKDSIIFDNVNNLVHLYGAAYVNYKNLKLTAAYITIDLKNNVATAVPLPDSVGKLKGLPNFKDDSQEFTAGEMKYNFRTQKGIVKDVTTKYNDAYVHGGLSKFVSSRGTPDSTEAGKKDSLTQRNDVAYSTDAIFTTCNADHPHFGIHSKKQKVIPNKLIIVGPSNLTIGDIPTPLVLPFAAFPLSAGKRTGLIFPRDYEYNQTFGYGLRNVGWYFPLSDNYDLTLQGDIYIRGTWGLRAQSNFLKTYKYSGRVEIGYASFIAESAKAEITRSPSWNIAATYNQDSRRNPLFTFQANINMQGSKSSSLNNYRGTTYNDFKNATTTTLSSSAGFSRTFPGKPYSLTGSLNQTQNTATRDVTVEPLNMDFRMQTIFPFKKTKRVGNERWYEKVSLQYSSSLKNRLQTKDSLLLNLKAWNNLQTGIKHDLSSSVNFTILKYFNQSFSVNYSESWYFSQYRRSFDPTRFVVKFDTLYNPLDSTDRTIRKDTTQYGKIDTVKNNGFYRVNQFSMGTNISTRIFGTLQFKSGKIRAIRHTMTPNIGFSYSPNYTRYEDSVQTDARSTLKQVYNLYQNAIFGAPSSGGAQAALTYSLTNLFEMKTFNKLDSTFKKIKILENVNIAGSYNFIADSFRFSQIAMGTGTNLFKGLSTLSVSALFDPYGRNTKGVRVKEFALKQNGKLLNFVNATVNLNSSLSIGDIKRLLKGNEDPNKTKTETTTKKIKPKSSEESLADMLESFRLSHNFSISRSNLNGVDTTIFQNTLYTSGNIPISKKWKVTVGNIGYDFTSKRMTYPDFGFYRDLHCWEMGMNWQPTRGTYSFYLRVKPGTLDFLKVPYNKNIGDIFNR